ncbi:DNA cytosine methyltransferase [uncultured Treponema sp.]|uniref:DNA cytosine methyltransferase n=1 Tax=uncultured Treponema sp. TaxID=162155 RepID=UPI0025D8D6BF|nr:DNA (cytosine-5-)-methyltransferase [uncultured Treponema sp.]
MSELVQNNVHLKEQELRLLSLFSGCGGMDLGFTGGFRCLKKSVNQNIHKDWIKSENENLIELKRTCFETVFANDIRPDAKAAWVSYFSKFNSDADKLYHLESIVDLVKEYKNSTFSFPDSISVVTGGFPCQDFSVAGKRLGFNSKTSHSGGKLNVDEPSDESRGKLYMWMRDVISITEPKLFVAENVKGLTNLADVKQIIEHDFSEAGGGYLVVNAKVLNASHYGVPQGRERVIFFGFKKSALTEKAVEELQEENISAEYNPYPQETHSKTDKSLCPIVTCADAFSELPEPEKSDDKSQQIYSKAKYMGKHCQGQTEVKLDDVGPTIRSEHHGNIEYRRLSAEHGGNHKDELAQNLQERRLTIRECARLQTFPDDYQFILPKTENNAAVSSSDAYKIIGNAVPCVLAYNIAMNIQQKWKLWFGDEK